MSVVVAVAHWCDESEEPVRSFEGAGADVVPLAAERFVPALGDLADELSMADTLVVSNGLAIAQPGWLEPLVECLDAGDARACSALLDGQRHWQPINPGCVAFPGRVALGFAFPEWLLTFGWDIRVARWVGEDRCRHAETSRVKSCADEALLAAVGERYYQQIEETERAAR